MGVIGAGKSLIAHRLASHLAAPLVEADELHSLANRNKMVAGIALTDADRWPWLDRVGQALGRQARVHGLAVAACSALREVYRERLNRAAELPIQYIFLDGSRDLLASRIAERSGHFMNRSLLNSQLSTLERPRGDNVLLCNIADPPQAIVAKAHVWLSGAYRF